jgi:hypothetical protein
MDEKINVRDKGKKKKTESLELTTSSNKSCGQFRSEASHLLFPLCHFKSTVELLVPDAESEFET